MQKLHLVGFTAGLDGLILSVRKGSSSGGFVVDLDDALVQLVGDADRVRSGGMVVQPSKEARSRASRHGSALNPRELQDRLRAGWTVEEVADEAGTDVEWVNRFAAPVKAEQARIVNKARAMTFDKPRLGPSSVPLGPSVRRNLAERGQQPPDDDAHAGWSAFQLDEGLWVVRFAYTSRGRAQQAEWLVDLDEAQLVARDRLASQLGHIGRGRARALAMKKSSPRKRSAPAAKRASVSNKVATKKTKAKKAPAKKIASAKKAPAKKAPAKKAPAKKAPAKKVSAKKVSAKKVSAKKVSAKKVASAQKVAPAKKVASDPVPRTGLAEDAKSESTNEAPISIPLPAAVVPSEQPQSRGSTSTPQAATAGNAASVDVSSATAPEPDDGEAPATEVAPPASRRGTSGEDRIFRGRRSAEAPPANASPPANSSPQATVGPLPPPAPIPVPNRVREAVSEPIGPPADIEAPPPINDADAALRPDRGPVRRSQPLRASPVFRPDLIQSAGGRPKGGEGRAGNGEGGTPPEEEPDPLASRSQSREAAPSAMDTLAALYPPPDSSSPAPEKSRRRRLRRG